MKQGRACAAALVALGLILAVGLWRTRADLLPLPGSLSPDAGDVRKVRILDRNCTPLAVTYQNRWNVVDRVALHEIPLFLKEAFIASEDKRFYGHHGVDWRARVHALWQDIRAFGAVRGASTITEQVVRLWHPRPRTLWSRWLEGIEACRLEKCFSKTEILAFYLNEVPYGAERRGVVQAARFYFDRDLDTLSGKEMLALAVLVRAPSRMDLHRNRRGVAGPIARLLALMQKEGMVDGAAANRIRAEELRVRGSALPVDAGHFVDFIYGRLPAAASPANGKLRTTLDASLQARAKTLLDNRLADLSDSDVRNGAVVIADNRSHEVLAWVTSGTRSREVPGSFIDAAATPRQPGSSLKPFLYALALERGWTPATRLDDVPLSEPVGGGLHTFHNYSRVHYGWVTLREALGNSLNIPAVRTLQFVGVETFLDCLHRLGIESLRKRPDFYGSGLALGNGEITLYELVQAYGALADRGVYHPLRMILNEDLPEPLLSTQPAGRVFSCETASLIGNILSDPAARRLEFGTGGVLDFPVQTAVKTGTSSDYRDAWAVGYTDRYTIGVWMGNLDRGAMRGISGARGPALVLRALFAELGRHGETRPLYLSPRLVRADICRDTGLPADGHCAAFSEWFAPGSVPGKRRTPPSAPAAFSLLQPTAGLQLAMDPRIPENRQAFPFLLTGVPPGSRVALYVDRKQVATLSGNHYLWPMQRGRHTARARLCPNGGRKGTETPAVGFWVK